MLSHFVTGPKDAPPLVFLHGFLGCKEDWEETFLHLEGRFRLYAYDLPGHGDSPVDASLDFVEAPLVGYSMGGRIALGLPSLSPRFVISAHPGLATAEEKAARWRSDQLWAEALRDLPFDHFLHMWYAQPLFASVKRKRVIFEKMMQRRLGQDPCRLAEALERFSLAKQEHRVPFPFPVHSLFGTEDLKFAEISSRLDGIMSVQSIQGCGHVIPYENPRELAARITASFHRYSLS